MNDIYFSADFKILFFYFLLSFSLILVLSFVLMAKSLLKFELLDFFIGLFVLFMIVLIIICNFLVLPIMSKEVLICLTISFFAINQIASFLLLKRISNVNE